MTKYFFCNSNLSLARAMPKSFVHLISASLLGAILCGCATLPPPKSYTNRDRGQPAAQLNIIPQGGYRAYNESEYLYLDEITCLPDGKVASQRWSLASWWGFTDDFPAYDASLPAGRVFLYYEHQIPQMKRSGRFAADLQAGHKYRFHVARQFINIFKGSSFTPTLLDLDTGISVELLKVPAGLNDKALCPATTS